MIGIALLGAIFAGVYGIVHDQVSYMVSPEYFTKLKFHQFHYANFGWPERAFAAEVGFLATWWVGLVAGWFLARAGLAETSRANQRSEILKAFALIFAAAAAAGIIGALLGVAEAHGGDLNSWRELQRTLEIEDLRAFIIVAYLHAGGYVGALLGLIAAIALIQSQASVSVSMDRSCIIVDVPDTT